MAMVPLVREKDVAPVTGAKVGVPQPEVEYAVELLMVTPAGRESVIEKFVNAVSAGARMTILNREFCPSMILVGLNVFWLFPVPIGIPVPETVMLAVAGSTLLNPGILVVREPAGILLA